MFNLSRIAENKNKFLIAGILIILLFAGLLVLYKPTPTLEPTQPTQTSQGGVPSYPPPLSEKPATSSGQPSAQKGTDQTEIIKILPLLPYATEHFLAKYDSNTKILAVTLYPILNRNTPEQIERYNTQLREYHKEFLDWLKSNNADPEKIAIVYNPNPTKPLSK